MFRRHSEADRPPAQNRGGSAALFGGKNLRAEIPARPAGGLRCARDDKMYTTDSSEAYVLQVKCCRALIAVGFFVLTLFKPNVFAQEAYSRWQPMRVVMHVHSKVSGEKTSLYEISNLAKRFGIQAVILTEYFEQKVSWGFEPFPHIMKLSVSNPSVMKYGLKKFFEDVRKINQKVPEVLMIPGVEVMPFYWWSGSLWKENRTVHDTQKNVLVLGLDEKGLKGLPTLERGKFPIEAYRGLQGEKPYQAVIDYVNQAGGMTIWSTPDEAFGSERKWGPIRLSTASYSKSLLLTEGYQGVGIFPEGFTETGIVGGIWDQLLKKYTRGRVRDPVFAYAEVVGHDQNMEQQIRLWDQIVYAEAGDEKAVLEALRKGRFYIRRSEEDEMLMNDFAVYDASGNAYGVMGEEVLISTQPVLHAAIRLPEGSHAEEISVNIIRGGEIVEVLDFQGRLARIEWPETKVLQPGECVYYRLMAHSHAKKNSFILSNPIFVRKK